MVETSAPASELSVRGDGLSWMDWCIERLSRVRGPHWAVGLLVAFALTVLLHAALWISGVSDKSALSLTLTVAASWAPVTVASFAIMGAASRLALTNFRPLTDLSDESYVSLGRRLTNQPPIHGVFSVVFATIWMFVLWRFDPTLLGLLTGNQPIDGAIWVFGWLNSAIVAMSLLRAVWSLTAISRLHAASGIINLFQPQPLFAFSGVTSEYALLSAFMSYAFYFSFPATRENPLILGVTLAFTLPIAIAALFVPVIGMHRRMVEAKESLQAVVSGRIEDAIGQVHGAMDGQRIGEFDGYNKLLATLVAEEEYIKKISTWPWESGTPGRLVSLLLLPLLFIVAQLVIERIFGG